MLNHLQLTPGTIIYHPVLQYCHVIANKEHELRVRYQDVMSTSLSFKEVTVPASDLLLAKPLQLAETLGLA